ncbi:MAG TPA: hypothetical protein ENN22_14160 [bacterium]|nr:hypothetical protein [bacterium]
MSYDMIICLSIFVFFLILIIAVIKTKGINKGGGIYTGQVLMHDLAMKDKQRAMEYVIENQKRTIKQEEESGENPKGANFKHDTDSAD